MAKFTVLLASCLAVSFSLSCTDKRGYLVPGRGYPASVESEPLVESSDQSVEPESRSFFVLPTGNGHTFQLFDSNANRLIGFLDHPYKYIRAPGDLRDNGIERRNLLEELSLGINENGIAKWLEDSTLDRTEYLEQTNIIHAHARPETKPGTKPEERPEEHSEAKGSDRYFFAPFGLEKNALVAMFRAKGTTGPKPFGLANLRFHLGANPVSPNFWDSTLDIVKIPGETLTRKDDGVWVETGHGLGAMVYIPLQGNTSGYCELSSDGTSEPGDGLGDKHCVAQDLSLMLTAPLDADGWFGVVVVYVEDASRVDQEISEIKTWVHGRESAALLEGALDEFANWRKRPQVTFHNHDERKLWRQSETILRMAQIREANIHSPSQLRANHGMILASIAPGGWATGWVRDGTYSTVALARAGHLPEAKKSLNFFLSAEPIGLYKSYVDDYDYRISLTRYFGDGQEEADYSNQVTPNIETDGWGLFLWASRQYLDSSDDLHWLNEPTRKGTVYEAMLNGVAKAIESQLENNPRIMKPDSSIWEVHQQNARHFAFTSLMAARGLCDFASIAKRSGHLQDYAKFSSLAAEIRRDFLQSFTTPEGYLVAAVERSPESDLDGAVAEAFGFDMFSDYQSPLATKTLEHLENLRLPTGGFKRVGGHEAYQTNEWAFINFRMAGAYMRMGKKAEAQALLDRMTKRAALNFYLFPEMYNAFPQDAPLGFYLGSNPMVGYGPGVYFLSLLERQGLFEDRNCD
jgi:GH15 family glucan-1,4-alpha-glucosidase